MEKYSDQSFQKPVFRSRDTAAALLILGGITSSIAIAEKVHHYLQTSENTPNILFSILVLTTLIGINTRLRKSESALPEQTAFIGLSTTSLPGFSDDISAKCWDIPLSHRLN